MTQSYQLTGMTCTSCEAKVKDSLLLLQGVSNVVVSKEASLVTITTLNKISVKNLQDAIGGSTSKYQITVPLSIKSDAIVQHWIVTYKPILIIFLYISSVSLLISFYNNKAFMGFMQYFMAGFFLVFSFFKMLNLKGFADSYKMYDVVAKTIPIWAYLYAFVELSLGIAYVINFSPLITNLVTLFVMGVSIIGVFNSVLKKRKIQCACLGVVFNLPMSTVTIIEDALMIIMSLVMLITLIH